MKKSELYRMLPSVDLLLKEAKLNFIIENHGRNYTKGIINTCLENIRNIIKNNDELEIESFNMDSIINAVIEFYENDSKLFTKVVNATGTVLHTNLGRSPISEKICEKSSFYIKNYCNLEYDIKSGKRGSRDLSLSKLICSLTGCEDAIAVNNNAAAVFLVVNTIASERKVVVSMDQLVEIGGSFRIPEIIKKSGAKLVAVGTTNKTYISDYKENISSDTSMVMKVSKSNFYIEGFTHSPDIDDLSNLAKEMGKVFYIDLGSGLMDDRIFKGKLTVKEAVKTADLVSFSCDKIFAGPQCGIICGKSKYISALRKNQLYRVLRTGKVVNAFLYETLKAYIENPKDIILNEIFTQTKDQLNYKAKFILKDLMENLESSKLSEDRLIYKNHRFLIEDTLALVGGGSLPRERLKSVAVNIYSPKIIEIDRFLRKNPIPVVGRLSKNVLTLDMICIFQEDLKIVSKKLSDLLKKMDGIIDEK